jgi:hypothetical protein
MKKTTDRKPKTENRGPKAIDDRRTDSPAGSRPSTLNSQLPQLTADELRELRVAILVHLYRVQPCGRRAPILYRLIQPQLQCTLEDIQAQLGFLQGNEFVLERSADILAPGLDPYYFITSDGMALCEEKKLV